MLVLKSFKNILFFCNSENKDCSHTLAMRYSISKKLLKTCYNLCVLVHILIKLCIKICLLPYLNNDVINACFTIGAFEGIYAPPRIL